jgi:hypothetical protein
MPSIILAERVIACTIQYGGNALAAKQHIQLLSNDQVNILLHNMANIRTAVNSAMSSINEDDS